MTVELDLSNGNIPNFPKKIEIKNAAQEDTLFDLLTALKLHNKEFKKDAKKAEKSYKTIEKIYKFISGNKGGGGGGGGNRQNRSNPGGGGGGGGGGGNNNNQANNQANKLQTTLDLIDKVMAHAAKSTQGATAAQRVYMYKMGQVSKSAPTPSTNFDKT